MAKKHLGQWMPLLYGQGCARSCLSLSVRDTYPSGIVFFFTMLKAGAGRAGDSGESAHCSKGERTAQLTRCLSLSPSMGIFTGLTQYKVNEAVSRGWKPSWKSSAACKLLYVLHHNCTRGKDNNSPLLSRRPKEPERRGGGFLTLAAALQRWRCSRQTQSSPLSPRAPTARTRLDWKLRASARGEAGPQRAGRPPAPREPRRGRPRGGPSTSSGRRAQRGAELPLRHRAHGRRSTEDAWGWAGSGRSAGSRQAERRD